MNQRLGRNGRGLGVREAHCTQNSRGLAPAVYLGTSVGMHPSCALVPAVPAIILNPAGITRHDTFSQPEGKDDGSVT